MLLACLAGYSLASHCPITLNVLRWVMRHFYCPNCDLTIWAIEKWVSCLRWSVLSVGVCERQGTCNFVETEQKRPDSMEKKKRKKRVEGTEGGEHAWCV